MLTINNVELEKSFIFPGGEVQIKLPSLAFKVNELVVKTILDSSDKIMELILVADALKYYYPTECKALHIEYLPYARQDRRIVEQYCLNF